jgi:predicted DCC family thiol-disulfide oxidoreductase YuxK
MSRLANWLVREHWLVGAALTRVLLGTWAIYHYALHLPVRGLLWGPDGVWPHERFLTVRSFPNVFQLSASPLVFEAIYVGAIAVALAYTLGSCPRILGLVHWWFIWSFQERNPFITDGGDNIMRIALLFLTAVNTGACLSLGSRHGHQAWPPVVRQGLAVAHNFGILLVLAQLSLLYLSTGLYKAMGELWQQGTALYYVLRVDEYSWPPLARLVYQSPWLVVLGTYGTVIFEVMFAPALFNRWLRYLAILAGMLFHVGIGLFMGLVTFAWSMLALYPLLITDAEYQLAAGWLRRRYGLTVLYDGWCPACTRSVRWLSAVDVCSLVDFVSLRTPGAPERWGLAAPQAATRIQSATADGRVAEGMDTMIRIFARSPVLWPGLPLLVAGRMLCGQRLYDALAARRLIVIPGGCASACAPDVPSTADRAGS